MSNHFHLLLQLRPPQHLSGLLADLLRSYLHYFNRRYGFVGHLFQGRFKSPAVAADSYLLSCGRYIERNPLEAGLVAEPWQYRWSSCRAYAQGAYDGLLAENAWYREFGADAGDRQQRWREFLLGEDLREEVVRRGEWVIGSDAFRGRMQRLQARPAPRGRGRPRSLPSPQDADG
jgi:putative transposase